MYKTIFQDIKKYTNEFILVLVLSPTLIKTNKQYVFNSQTATHTYSHEQFNT